MKSFNYKQTPIYYQDEGEGKPLLLIHGFLENSSMWNDFTKLWKSNFRVIRIDLPGHGNTPAHTYLHSMAFYAQVCHQLITNLKLEKTIVVGHSMGGYIGLELIDQFPDKIDQLILLNSTALADSEERKAERTRAVKAIQQFPEAFVSMAVKNLFLPENQNRLKQAIEKAIAEAKKCTTQGIIATLEGLKTRRNHQETLAKTKVKSTIVAGKKDQVVNYASTKQLAKETSTRLVSLPGGHMSHLEFPQETFEIISNLIAKE